MKEPSNVELVAKLQPDFLGFIFWERSPRFCVEVPQNLPKNVDKVGVFVNASFDFILEKIKTFDLQAVQLHGQETPEFCAQLNPLTTVIKVFSIKDRFDFSELSPYETVCDYYLFDTKGKLPGGNGEEFDWKVLRSYPSQKPFFLSGGIGIDSVEKIHEICQTTLPVYALDVNSKFEIAPGIKNKETLKKFKQSITL
jgi:phosphoribosylanthranilate isomerase